MENQQVQQNEFKQGDVALLQLITGQLVFGKTSIQDDQYMVTEPFELVMLPDPQTGRPVPRLARYGAAGGLLPPMAVAPFDPVHVLHLRECPEGLKNDYLRATSGIQVATPAQKSAILTGV